MTQLLRFPGAVKRDPAIEILKLRPGENVDATALAKLIETAYADMQKRVHAEALQAASSRA